MSTKQVKPISLTYSHLTYLSLPSIFALAIEQFSGFIDAMLIGNKDSSLLAVFSITNTVICVSLWVFGFFSTVVSVNISFYYGKKDFKKPVSIKYKTKLTLPILNSNLFLNLKKNLK